MRRFTNVKSVLAFANLIFSPFRLLPNPRRAASREIRRRAERWGLTEGGDRYSGRSPEVSVRKVTMLVNAWHICRKGGRRRKPFYCYLLAIIHEDTRVCQSARRLKPEQQFSRRVVGTEVSLTSRPAALM